jgi:hypothetical protein
LLPPGTPRERLCDTRLSLIDAVMDVLHTSQADLVVLNEATPVLMHPVVKFGRVLYDDPVTGPAIDFCVYVTARYSDTAPTRRLAYRYLQEWIDGRARSMAPQA